MLARLEVMVQSVARVITLVGLVGLTLIAFAVMADVLGRWLFSSPIKGLLDIVSVLLPLSIGAALPSVVATRGNITMRFLDNVLGWRASRALEALGGTLGLMILLFVAWLFFRYAAYLVRHNYMTWTLDLPTGPFWYGFAILIFISAAFQVIVLLRDLTSALYGNPTDSNSHN